MSILRNICELQLRNDIFIELDCNTLVVSCISESYIGYLIKVEKRS